MGNKIFTFKQFSVNQDRCAMKVGTDAVLLGAWTAIQGSKNILDIGSGTGILCLMLAQRMEDIADEQSSKGFSIRGIEIDSDAYMQSVENCKKSKWSHRIEIENISFQQFVLNLNHKFDLIISNPPFFQKDLLSANEQKNKARHNTELSFADLVNGIKLALNEQGKFTCILPFREANLFIEECKKENLHLRRLTKVFSSQKKNEVKRLLMQFEWKEGEFQINELYIEKENRHDYTETYQLLTKDFYLKF